ncbi:flavin reductase family protein [Nocardia africana]|uniref:Flavin-dependent monooxygenase, reductase subunit HsaB n=1 Tax=Nocardia africana TaxID=134964 RepID=A0A378X1L0_9NOCA|nr:flavin reductase family protein [Nocardia africana]MCC3311700.1 flavin reductase family protein [Nocardia africana]SUA47032.1 Flavin-dependent monooxygenase, reductase subunit HsaB [Nocardia africana]
MEPVVQVDEISEATFKSVLSRFCSGVTVITALSGDQPIGFSCQSFSSLSLDPPRVCFFPARTSTSWPRIREVGRFCVNILAHDQADVCRALARSGTDKFAGVDWELSGNGSPRLSGALASIDCELDREVDGGDHTIVIARVTALAEHSEQAPLLFYRSSFERLHGH